MPQVCHECGARAAALADVTLAPPGPLDPGYHRVDAFTCGNARLDTWLRAYAGQSQRRDAARTYVAADPGGHVAGYYTLVVAQLDHERATGSVRRGMSKRFPIPVVLLARLAVDRPHQGTRFGAALLADAMRRAVRAADEVVIRAILIDAIDQQAAAFYQRFGFEPLPGDDLTLMATIAQVRNAAT
ncbi:GNAT family N-acetyltransferase [Paraconexibacter sp. AEG42_29]